MSKRVYVFVNGVMTWPGRAGNWNSRAAVHCICYHDTFAITLEYLTLPSITRFLFQRQRAFKLAKKIQQFIHKRGWDLYLVGHSNGCDVILDCLRMLDWPRVEELHLISGACEASFALNGLNGALRNNMVGKVHYYIAAKDWPLWVADTWAGWSFGYGTHPLGRSGPLNLDEDIPSVDKRVVCHVRDDFRHSSWFAEGNFVRTMDLVLGM